MRGKVVVMVVGGTMVREVLAAAAAAKVAAVGLVVAVEQRKLNSHHLCSSHSGPRCSWVATLAVSLVRRPLLPLLADCSLRR